MPIILIGGVSMGNQVVRVDAEPAGKLPESFRKLSAADDEPAGNFPKDWRKVRKILTDQQVGGIADSEARIISAMYGVDERTARNWRRYAREEREAATTTAEAGQNAVISAGKE